MKKLMNKKINVFGKGIPMFAIVLMSFALVSAALIPYFGQITGSVTVIQGLTVDGASYDTALVDSYDAFTSLEEKNYASKHNLKNNADVDASLELGLTKTSSGGNDFSDISTSYLIASQDSIIAGADRLVETQNNDGSWEWNSPDTNKENGPGAGNTYGVTAMGLLNAYEITGDQTYLDSAKITGDDMVAKATDESDGNFYSQDIEFLVRLGELAEDSTYTTKAGDVMNHFMIEDNRYCVTNGCTAEELANFYETSYPSNAGLTEWQLSSWVRAADLTGEGTWADAMVDEIADDVLTSYFDVTSTTGNVIIGLAGVLDATGSEEVADRLLELQNSDGGWDSDNPEGETQDVAYAVMALAKQDDAELVYSAVMGAKWLKDNQDTATGGWKNDAGTENTELTSEALWAVPVESLVADTEFVIPANTESVFYIVNEFAKMLIPDTYSFTTEVKEYIA